MKRLIIVVTGDVQGVNFRYEAQLLASYLALTGYVRNQPDGSVYIEVEGEPATLVKFLAWSRVGSSHARVTGISHTVHGSIGYKDFTIR
jgi:acylphosphatase